MLGNLHTTEYKIGLMVFTKHIHVFLTMYVLKWHRCVYVADCWLQRMILFYWPVIVLSVSIASVVSESQVGSSGLTARTIVPSPRPDCWSPSCLTWSQCLADPSQCFTSHTTVTMLPGEYILHEYVKVSSVVSLSIYGSRSEGNGSTSENQVVINCEYREGGIGFTDLVDFSLVGLTMVYCGVKAVNRVFRNDNLPFLYIALLIVDGFNVNLDSLNIANSTQVGLLCINLLGTSGIQNSVVTHSNYRMLEKYMQGEVECSMDNWECCGSNVLILFFNSIINEKAAFDISNFTVERTNISYGVNLIHNISPTSNGAGIAVELNPGLEYDVQITIDRCYFMNNIDIVAAHLYLGIYSSCSVLVKDSNFTYANRITDGDPLELVSVVHPRYGTLTVYVEDMFDDTAAAIDVDIVMNEVYIAENVGGCLHVTLCPQLSQSYIELMLRKTAVVHNFLVQDTFVRFEELMTSAGGLYLSLESVEINNNIFVIQDEIIGNQEYFNFHPFSSALSLANIVGIGICGSP